METQKQDRKIIWAVDAFTDDMEFQRKAAKILEAFVSQLDVPIEPVYVLGPDPLRLSKDLFPEQVGKFKLEAEAKLDIWLKTTNLKGLMPPTVLVSDSLSLRSAVNALLSYARETKASLIAVSTMARKGVTRFLLGSFAETVILLSEIPVFVINPKSPIDNRISHILFPTDFTPKSKEVLDTLSGFAKAMKADVTVFHQVEYMTPFTTAPFMSATYSSYLEKDVTERRKKGELWIKELQNIGLKADLIISEQGNFPTDSIIKQAEKMKNAIIAMASQSGVITSSLLGSVTRQVLRVSPCPVWVIHPQEKSSIESEEQLARQRARF